MEIIIERQLTGQLMREGAGVKLHRYIGTDRKNNYDPILLFDFFDSADPLDYIGGFPNHPHRGFETITYILKGKMAHHDNHSHQGIINAGDVQWMTAGRGIIHSEMPDQKEGQLSGLQLWLNLPAAKKMSEPNYQEFTSTQLPIEQQQSGARIKVIAGKTKQGTESPLHGIATEPLFLDITLPALQTFEQPIAETHQTILFVIDGAIQINNQIVKKHNLAVLSKGSFLSLQGNLPNSHCLLIAAKKIKEPIAWLGPFVMNTEEEIKQAVEDFRKQRF